MKRTRSRPVISHYGVVVGLIALLVSGAALVLFLPTGFESKALLVSAVYAVLVTGFLIAQFWGFIVSQTHYNDSIEEPKFVMLEKEESEWNG